MLWGFLLTTRCPVLQHGHSTISPAYRSASWVISTPGLLVNSRKNSDGIISSTRTYVLFFVRVIATYSSRRSSAYRNSSESFSTRLRSGSSAILLGKPSRSFLKLRRITLSASKPVDLWIVRNEIFVSGELL